MLYCNKINEHKIHLKRFMGRRRRGRTKKKTKKKKTKKKKEREICICIKTVEKLLFRKTHK